MKRTLLVPVLLAAACGAFAQEGAPARITPPRAEESGLAEARVRPQRVAAPDRIRAAEAQAEAAKIKYRLIVEEYAFGKDVLAAELASSSDPRALLQAAVKRGEATVTVRAGTSTGGAAIAIKQERKTAISAGANQVSYHNIGVSVSAVVPDENAIRIEYQAQELGAGVKVGNDSIPSISHIEFSARLPLEFGKSALLGVVPPDEAIAKSRAVIVRLEKQD